MSKKIFITGIAGFIGYHLARALKARGDDVIGCDNFNDYYAVALKKARSADLERMGITVKNQDICKLLNHPEAFSEFTHFVHLAAQAGVRYSLKNPNAYTHTNIQGFLSVLEVCRNTPQMRLIYASSSSVYGLQAKTPFLESDPANHPISLYAATKKSGEMMAHAYHHLYKIPMIGLRFFTVYGPWGRPDMAYFSFAKNILQGKSIQLFNHGDMLRDFTYIDDIIDGTIAAIDRQDAFALYNLGGHQTEKLLSLVTFLEEALGKKAQVEKLPMQQGDVYETLADITLSKKHLNFTPKVRLDEGISRFCEWFLKNPQFH